MVNPRPKGSRDLWSGGDELLGSSPPGEDLQEWAKDEKLKQIKTNIEISQSPSPGIVGTTCSKLESPLVDSDSPPLCPLSLPSVSARAPRRAITLFCSRARLAFTWVLLVSRSSSIDYACFCLLFDKREFTFLQFCADRWKFPAFAFCLQLRGKGSYRGW